MAGLVTGLLIGLLQVVTGRFYAVPLSFEIVILQVGIDYFIAFMVAGFAGLLRPAFMKAYEQKDKMKMALSVIAGAFIAAFLRYLLMSFQVFYFSENLLEIRTSSSIHWSIIQRI